MDIASVVKVLNEAAEAVESLSGKVLTYADKASGVLDEVAETLENLAGTVNERSESDEGTEAGGSENKSPQDMYEYILSIDPTTYDNEWSHMYLTQVNIEMLSDLYEQFRRAAK